MRVPSWQPNCFRIGELDARGIRAWPTDGLNKPQSPSPLFGYRPLSSFRRKFDFDCVNVCHFFLGGCAALSSQRKG